jgi:inorganic pyrophosphatase
VPDIEDVETELPGTIDKIREWYRVYKVADGKEPNTYEFGEKALNRVCSDTHVWLLSVQRITGAEAVVFLLVTDSVCRVQEKALSVIQQSNEAWGDLYQQFKEATQADNQ